MAVLSSYGIHECAVYENGDIDLTYFRSFERTTEANAPGIDSQVLQKLMFNCQIVPIHKNDSFASLCRLRDAVCCPPSTYQISGVAAQKYRPFMSLSNGNIVYSTCGLLENGHTEIRVYNAGSDEATSELLLPVFANSARKIELDGRVIEDLKIVDGKVKLTLPAWKIATIEVF